MASVGDQAIPKANIKNATLIRFESEEPTVDTLISLEAINMGEDNSVKTFIEKVLDYIKGTKEEKKDMDIKEELKTDTNQFSKEEFEQIKADLAKEKAENEKVRLEFTKAKAEKFLDEAVVKGKALPAQKEIGMKILTENLSKEDLEVEFKKFVDLNEKVDFSKINTDDFTRAANTTDISDEEKAVIAEAKKRGDE
jgi:hypothetical protein